MFLLISFANILLILSAHNFLLIPSAISSMTSCPLIHVHPTPVLLKPGCTLHRYDWASHDGLDAWWRSSAVHIRPWRFFQREVSFSFGQSEELTDISMTNDIDNIRSWCFLQWEVSFSFGQAKELTDISMTLMPRYGPYQSSVTILGFYLPSAIVICLLIGESLEKGNWCKTYGNIWMEKFEEVLIHF